MSGRRILVTGASRGIGRAVALACAEQGATIGLGFRTSRAQAEETARLVEQRGARAILVDADIGDPAAVERAFASFASEAGGLDALVANAATHVAGLLATTDPAALERIVRVNTLGPLACARAAIAAMLPQRAGVLLFVGSVAASRPARGQAAYAATKASVEALTRAIAVEYGRKGIRAVCLRPGAVATDMLETTRAMAEEEVVLRIPARRIATPDEIARVAALLISADASYVNGAVIDVDGGYAVG